MRDVEFGWLLRYLHSAARRRFSSWFTSMFEACTVPTGSLELIWLFGMAIFLVLMAEGFMGYLLPWGNMSSGVRR